MAWELQLQGVALGEPSVGAVGTRVRPARESRQPRGTRAWPAPIRLLLSSARRHRGMLALASGAAPTAAGRGGRRATRRLDRWLGSDRWRPLRPRRRRGSSVAQTGLSYNARSPRAAAFDRH